MERLRRFWQTLNIDLPWAISNWLFANIINPLLASLGQLSLWRIVRVAAFLLVIWSVAQVFPPDLAVMFAGDTALYVEIASFAYLAIARGRLHLAVVSVAQMTYFSIRRMLIRAMARARRPMRRPCLFDKDDSGDVPDGAFA